MQNSAAVARIAKLLARATSPEREEAAVALKMAYDRMGHDGVSVTDLLELPVESLYQDALLKLVDLIVAGQTDLSPSGRRDLYATYVEVISEKFKPREPTRAEQSRDYQQRRGRSSEPKSSQMSPVNPPSGEDVPGPDARAFVFRWRGQRFSFSPAAFFSALAPTFGPGSLFAHSLDNPGRCLQLLAASLLWGMGFAGVLILLASSVHAVTGTMPWIDVRLASVFTGLSAIGTVWKGRALFQSGWFY